VLQLHYRSPFQNNPIQDPLSSDSKQYPIVSHRPATVVDFVVILAQTGAIERSRDSTSG
jgi:hypothetical protein